MKKIFIPFVVGIFLLVYWRWHVSVPVLLTIDYHSLLKVKEKVLQQDPYYYTYYQRLIHDAEKCLYDDTYSVAEKKNRVSTNDMHDKVNFSMNHYSFTKEDDTSSMTASNIRTLILAGFFSGQERYNSQAAQLLRNLFIPDENLVGQNPNRPETVTEVCQLISLLDVYPLLQQTAVWSDDDHEQTAQWTQQYLELLLHDKHKIQEDEACDNDSIWYEAQVAVLAYFIRHDTRANQAVQRAKKLILSQIEPDGRQLFNLNNHASSYCTIRNLQAFYILSSVGERIGEHLWRYTTPDGRSLQKASDYVFHSFLQMSERQNELKNEEALLSLLLKAQQVYQLREYEPYLNKLLREVPDYWPVLLYSG